MDLTNRERFTRLMRGDPVDRAPFFPCFGPWPQTLARWHREGLAEDADWREILIYDRKPAVGALRHSETDNILWALANGWETKSVLRLLPLEGKRIARSELNTPPEKVMFDGKEYLEIVLAPFEVGLIEWEESAISERNRQAAKMSL